MIMKLWSFYDIDGHIFSYNEHQQLVCSCGRLRTRVEEKQVVDVSKRHVRALTRYMKELMVAEM
jgi:hypothetical protein